MLLLTVLAVVCLVMGIFLVVNVVSATVTQQRRQIGVMKAIGARPRETAALYLGSAGIYGLAAFVLAVPLSAVGALLLIDYAVGLINLDAAAFSIPPYVLALQAAAAIALPLAAALVPAMRASRLTVRQAIAGGGHEGSRGLPGLLAERAARVPVAARLALTNALRRKGRLVLTVAALALGGAVFVGVLSVRESLYRTLDEGATYAGYDVGVNFERPYPGAALERAALGTPGVARAEAWSVEGAYRVRPDGSESETFSVVGAPAGSDLLQPRIVRGRGLRPGDGRAVVVNTDVLESEEGLRPGDRVRLSVNGRPPASWRVVGIAQRIVIGPVMYADGVTLARAAGEEGLARRLVVGTDGSQDEVAAALTDRLQREGFAVTSARTSAELEEPRPRELRDHRLVSHGDGRAAGGRRRARALRDAEHQRARASARDRRAASRRRTRPRRDATRDGRRAGRRRRRHRPRRTARPARRPRSQRCSGRPLPRRPARVLVLDGWDSCCGWASRSSSPSPPARSPRAVRCGCECATSSPTSSRWGAAAASGAGHRWPRRRRWR